jgi:hypothetical protein
MEKKRFNYIEFKIDIINNELIFLENYLLSNIDRIDENSWINIKKKLAILNDKLTQMEKNNSEVKEEKEEVKEELKDTSIPSIDTLKYNRELVHKMSQINFII